MSRSSLISIRISLVLVIGSVTSITLADDLPPPASHKVDYATEIRPLLERSCVKCHGDRAQKGGLVLNVRDLAFKGGDDGPIIQRGKSAESKLITAVSGLDDNLVMPPTGVGEALSAKEVGLLRAWIDQGATWPDALAGKAKFTSNHWAFQPIKQHNIPTTKTPGWVRNPIDSFVLSSLERQGTKPAPEATRETLLRRLSLDLIGLLPTIAEIDAFLADKSPNAYEKQVDRLLASPHYGERWARRWLDRARYADTNGYEKDRERSIWPYRDWVINALNRDMPFDQFTIEQIAGDLLPNATPSQRVATGFHRNTMINEEGGIDVEEFRFASIVDRVSTTGTVWLGLSLQCAQCHSHKYDPISQRDYYRFFALLNNCDEIDLPLPTQEIEAKAATVEAEARKLELARADHFPIEDPRDRVTALVPKTIHAESKTSLTAEKDGVIVASGAVAAKDVYDLEFELPAGAFDAIRLETVADAKGKSGPGRTPHGNFVITEIQAELRKSDSPKAAALAWSGASADVQQSGFDVSQAIDGNDETGWAIDNGKQNLRKPHQADFKFKETLKTSSGSKLHVKIRQNYGGGHTLERFRLLAIKAEDPALASEAAKPERRAKHLQARFQAWLDAQQAHEWKIEKPTAVRSLKGATMDPRPDGSILARGDKPNNDTYFVDLDGDLTGVSAVRVEVLPDESLPDNGPGRAPLFSVGDFILTNISAEFVTGDDAKPTPLTFARASEDYSEAGHPASLAIDAATDTGWTVKGGIGKPHAAVFEFATPLPNHPKGTRLRLTLRQDGIHQMTIGRFRIATTKTKGPVLASSVPAELEAIVARPTGSRSDQDIQALRNYYLSVAPELEAYNKKIADLRRTKPHTATSMIMEERPKPEARRTRIHKRGEFQQPTEVVEPGVIGFLRQLPSDAPADRLALARWLVASDNPLAPRVFVNQAWQAFFGRGLVPTVEDFGTQGDKPSHAELLDWLANEAIRLGWSQKALHRLIVTSASYRQASKVDAGSLAGDPHNDRLARGPRVRVEAEMVRDIALSASGLINLKVGGPSVYPPQPDGVTSLAYGGASWPTSSGADRYRRGMYTFIKRTAPYATFGLFDAPNSDVACVRRERSNTPLQALTLLNDPVYVEAATALAGRILKEAAPYTKDRITHGYRLVLGRVPQPHEIEMIEAFITRQQTSATEAKNLNKEAAERALWTAVARALLNLDETITKE